ncbi:GNAT family N-acetyltransferase [Blautia liquoris]|uniref:GNAT family N-acetyltransferase n=1 Tax=Blautia liquoris TaxID=2779518 RepID=A0A7M2RD21_9FIRM|nr:GNAT family N-acetyltransferase [Blautia liquoris]QOV18225.1 GNAT family N-acetyltransferase [Blautia liquoris]
MFRIKKMQENDCDSVLNMVMAFYDSPAVSHTVSKETLTRTFKAAVAGDQGLDGYKLMEGERICGYCYVTEYYACEVGGKNVMIEELYFDPSARNKGYGTEMLNWIFKSYPGAKRYRLEVTDDNPSARRLYERLGFTALDYGQMVRDVL